MAMERFTFTRRARPIVQVGIGDTRIPVGSGRWDVSRWDQPSATWAGSEPMWLDVTCDVRNLTLEYGRDRVHERYRVGTADVLVDNHTGWADPRPQLGPDHTLTMRPGRAIRVGVVHAVLGTRWLWRGVVDEMVPTYEPVDVDTVRLVGIDALGEVNRAKLAPYDPPQGAGDTAYVRTHRILNAASWPEDKRDIGQASTVLLASDLGGQVADLLGVTADSCGGAVWGDVDGNVAFRPMDWQMFSPTTPPDGTIGNVGPDDVCPVLWERPYQRADIATRVLLARQGEDTRRVYDDAAGQVLFGIEPFERTDLLAQNDATLDRIGPRLLAVRSAATAPRVRSVTLNAATSDDALDLMTTVDVYRPSRYRCRLAYADRGPVFDAEHFATGVRHVMTPDSWELELNLDLSGAYAATGGRWDVGRWDRVTWAA